MYYHGWDVGTGNVVHAFEKHGHKYEASGASVIGALPRCKKSPEAARSQKGSTNLTIT